MRIAGGNRKPRWFAGWPWQMFLPCVATAGLFVFVVFAVVLPTFKQTFVDRKKEMLRSLTESAYSVVAQQQRLEAEGVLSREAAQAGAIAQLRAMRYGPEMKDYFWITDVHPRGVMHPYRPELEGEDLTNAVDPTGKRLFVAFVEAAREGGAGFVDYMWQRQDDGGRVIPKLSYVKAFEPWGWIIGTGLYIEDAQAEIAGLLRTLLWWSGGILVAILSLLTVAVTYGARARRRRFQAEEGLREVNEWLRGILDSSPLAVFVLDLEGYVQMWSPAAEAMFGWKAAEVIGGRLPVVTSEGVGGLWPELRRVMTGANRTCHEVRCQRRDRTWLDISASAAAVRAADGGVVGVIAVAADVTERRKMRQALDNEREQLLSIFDSIEDPVYVSDPTTYELLYTNEAFRKTWGEVEGGTCHSVLQGVDRPCAFCTNDLIFGEFLGRPYVWELCNQRNGRWYRCTDKAIRWPDGRVVRYQMAVDVSERKQAEEAHSASVACLQRQQAALVRLATEGAVAGGDLPRALRTVTEVVAETLGVERASVWLLDEKRELLRCVDLFERTSGEHLGGAELPAAVYPEYFEALKTGRVVDAREICCDPRTKQLASYLEPLGITSLLGGAIRVSGELAGVVWHAHVGTPRTWRPDEVTFAGEVADQVAQALVNSARHEAEQELKRRVAELSEAKRRLEVLVANTAGRERMMVTLKEEVNELLEALGREVKYVAPQQVAELKAVPVGQGTE